MSSLIRFDSLEMARAYLAKMRPGHVPAPILVHCAQSIEYSMHGFPRMRNWLFRATIGRLAARIFIGRGHLSHNLKAEIPGAPSTESESDPRAAMKRLQDAITEFENFGKPLSQHFAYGKLSKDEFDQLHAFHLADHLGVFDRG
jgi:hypothetical protein